MRKIIKFFDIILISLAIFVFCLSSIVSNYTLNKKYIQKVLRDNKVYSTINDEIKINAKTDLKVGLSNIPNLDVDDLVDKTITEDIIENEVDFILTELYTNNKMRVDLSILSKGYTENLNKYLDENKIDVPKEVREQINNIYNTNSLQVEDVDIFNDNYAKYYVKGKDIIKKVKLYSLCTIIGLVALTLLLAREKLRGLYIPSLLSAGMLYGGGITLKTVLDTQDIKIGDKKLDNIITSIKNGLFNTINKYAIALVIIAVMLIIVKIIFKIIKGKKSNDNVDTTGVEEVTPEEKAKFDNDVPPYYKEEETPVIEESSTNDSVIEDVEITTYDNTGNEPVNDENKEEVI